MTQSNYIAYYRVSTNKQGKSGLGLDAQRDAAHNHIKATKSHLIDEYIEVESTRKKTRPELNKALSVCKKQKATLLIAKLDRLGRNVAFIATLMESKVDFICCDNPHANRLMLHMLAAFAEHEREQISIRTKEALTAAKARGVILGKNGKEILAPLNKKRAKEFAESLRTTINEIKKAGNTTIRAICDELNQRAIPTAQNKTWHYGTTYNLLKRLGI
ncbi:recombinase family protein [candidate division KSB1 bacterium]|nr:recombinase family protein [candidate division KSB1 bacterium]